MIVWKVYVEVLRKAYRGVVGSVVKMERDVEAEEKMHG